MPTTIGVILIAIALANDCFTAWLNWRCDMNNGKGPSGITGVPVLFYTGGACLIWPALWRSGPTVFLIALSAALAFHVLFILGMTEVVHRLARISKR